jgi:hypothetical protein
MMISNLLGEAESNILELLPVEIHPYIENSKDNMDLEVFMPPPTPPPLICPDSPVLCESIEPSISCSPSTPVILPEYKRQRISPLPEQPMWMVPLYPEQDVWEEMKYTPPKIKWEEIEVLGEEECETIRGSEQDDVSSNEDVDVIPQLSKHMTKFLAKNRHVIREMYIKQVAESKHPLLVCPKGRKGQHVVTRHESTTYKLPCGIVCREDGITEQGFHIRLFGRTLTQRALGFVDKNSAILKNPYDCADLIYAIRRMVARDPIFNYMIEMEQQKHAERLNKRRLRTESTTSRMLELKDPPPLLKL